MAKKKIYKTVLTVVILSETPYRQTNLKEVGYDITEGDCTGGVVEEIHTELIGEEAAKEMYNVGSQPDFFMMDEEGNDTSDDE